MQEKQETAEKFVQKKLRRVECKPKAALQGGFFDCAILRCILFLSVLERLSGSVRTDASRQDQYAFHKAPYAGDDGGDPEGCKPEQHEDQLGYRLARISQVKIMDSKASQENTEQSRGNLGFAVRVRLRIRILRLAGKPAQLNAAMNAYRVFIRRFPAVPAVVVPAARGRAACPAESVSG